MKLAIPRSVLLGAVVAAFPFAGASDSVRIDGGSEWESNWYVQVDGVMGGKSSGKMEFMEDNSIMKFTGDINLDGGGFSSVRRRVSLDLSEYAGVVVTLEADLRGAGQSALPPTGLHLQFDDRTSRYDYSSAFAIPLSTDYGEGPVVTSVYLPVESFDRGDAFGFPCRNGCQLDASEISGISVYVLFQEGSFDVRLRSIEAVMEPRAFPLPAYDVLESESDVIALIQSTISSGGGLYDKSYVELCAAMYWSVLNTIISSDVVSEPIKAVICAGLQQVEAETNDGANKATNAWTLRYVLDAVVADLQGSSRTSFQDWLPTTSEAASMEVTCLGRTSAAPGFMYDPTNQFLLVSDTQEESMSIIENEDETEEVVSNIEAKGEEPISDSTTSVEEDDSEEIITAAVESSNEFSSGAFALFSGNVESAILGTVLLGFMVLV